MALKIPVPFPIFAPPAIQSPNNPNRHNRAPSELRFARWNNANAEKFNQRQRTIKEIEDDLRRDRRYTSASRIARYYDTATPSPSPETTSKSAGTPSHPSEPSIPGKKSKYSKNPNPNPNPNHPAFRRFHRSSLAHRRSPRPRAPVSRDASVRIGDDGVSYVIEGAPFEFKYSYTESPRVKPVGLREEAYAPFGPATMPRPWTGRAPLPESKKAAREFDSFVLPPPHKKGVKSVQRPGPFLPGSGPKYVRTREEILGDPLTKEERSELIEGCKKTRRQLNMGRDGLTHNMLDNIHAHWMRRRVCKIKCKGVCTVDMQNILEQLEERTGGKVIYSTGGVIYLYRGRNYNFRTRQRFPLMLWKPITPVYPRLVQRVPEGTTLAEVTEMRKKGHGLIPICKLGKNGVYSNLVALVREAFEECELARINCQGMNGSDYRKIGAKLRDLVPCVLISYAYEHILMWRGRDWQPSLPKLDLNPEESKESLLQSEEISIPKTTFSIENPDPCYTNTISNGSEVADSEGIEESLSSKFALPLSSAAEDLNSIIEPDTSHVGAAVSDNSVYTVEQKLEMGSVDELLIEGIVSEIVLPDIEGTETKSDSVEEDLTLNENQRKTLEAIQDVIEPASIKTACTEGVLLLLQQALESGSAMILNKEELDADIVYEKMVAFSQSAPAGPVFAHRPRKVKVMVEKSEVQEDEEQDIEDLESQVMTSLSTKGRAEKNGSKPKTRRKTDLVQLLDSVVPQGSLRVDELAKLLA